MRLLRYPAIILNPDTMEDEIQNILTLGFFDHFSSLYPDNLDRNCLSSKYPDLHVRILTNGHHEKCPPDRQPGSRAYLVPDVSPLPWFLMRTVSNTFRQNNPYPYPCFHYQRSHFSTMIIKRFTPKISRGTGL